MKIFRVYQAYAVEGVKDPIKGHEYFIEALTIEDVAQHLGGNLAKTRDGHVIKFDGKNLLPRSHILGVDIGEGKIGYLLDLEAKGRNYWFKMKNRTGGFIQFEELKVTFLKHKFKAA